MSTLTVNTIGSTGSGDRLLVLLHGYGADEHDLAPIASMIDPTGRFFAVAPRAPLDVFPYGAGWYERTEDRRIEPAPFLATIEALDATIDSVCEAHDLDRETSVVVGFSQGGPTSPDRDRETSVVVGFSQGGAMALASGLRVGAPARPAAIACLSGMINEVEGLEYAFDEYLPPVLVQHGSLDQVVPVERGHLIRDAFIVHGVEHHYREYPMGHEISPASLTDLRSWLSEV